MIRVRTRPPSPPGPPERLLAWSVVEFAVRLLLGAVLFWAGASKLRRPTAFADGLGVFGVPAVARRPLTYMLIGAELVLGGLLLAAVATPLVATATAVLGALFVAVLIGARVRGHRTVACRCFGSEKQQDTVLLAVRAGVIVVLAVGLMVGLPSAGSEAILPVAVAVLAAAVVALGVLVLALYRQVGVLSQRLSPGMALEIDEEGPVLNAPSPPL